MADFTKVFHSSSYAAISPTLPSLSQAGRTVLITGGSAGIGFAISRAFVVAGAARLILVARRKANLEAAKSELLKNAQHTDGAGHSLDVVTESCDVGDVGAVRAMWASFKERGIAVDVMVLNAASTKFLHKGLLGEEDGVGMVVGMYEFNVFANLRMTEAFLRQGAEKGKALLNVSSCSVHVNPAIPGQLGYSSTKNAFTTLLQFIADEVEVENTQMISFHPGSILTDAVRASGYGDHPLAWDDEDLPGHFAVWAASKEAKFLHGRFVWAHWDVDELIAMKDKFENAGFLKMGLQGPNPMQQKQLWELLTRGEETPRAEAA